MCQETEKTPVLELAPNHGEDEPVPEDIVPEENSSENYQAVSMHLDSYADADKGGLGSNNNQEAAAVKALDKDNEEEKEVSQALKMLTAGGTGSDDGS